MYTYVCFIASQFHITPNTVFPNNGIISGVFLKPSFQIEHITDWLNN